jgi:hypothetical protein
MCARTTRTRLGALLLAATLCGAIAASASPAAADEAPQAEFTGAEKYGFAVAMSADGSTAVVGQLGDSTFADVPGVAHILTLEGSGWTQQTELSASDPSYDMFFGNAVALSADGNTLIVGDPGECGYGLANCEHGAAYVFIRSGSTWTQQAELHGGPGFGGAVALSSDGNTALIGAGLSGTYGVFFDPSGNGSPTVFSRSGATWTEEATLSASDASLPYDNFGYAVALSGEGTTALIGDPYRNEENGAAYVFSGSGSSWTQQAELTGTDSAGGEFGRSVALSADGHTALVGAPFAAATKLGAAYVFSGSGSSWTQQAELTASDAGATSSGGFFGMAVALSSEGTTALIGAPFANNYLGAAYAFAELGEGWTQQAEFTVSGATPYDYFGDAVALNAQGSTALIGRIDPGAYIFAVPRIRPRASAPPSGVAQTSTTSEPAATTSPPSGGPRVTLTPVARETLSPSAFLAAVRGVSALTASRRYGTNVSYTLNEPAGVRFTVAQAEQGREVRSGRCAKPTKANRDAHRCTRLVALRGSFTRAGSAAANRFRFTGRLAGRTLKAGRYQLVATPSAGGETGPAATASFRVLK